MIQFSTQDTTGLNADSISSATNSMDIRDNKYVAMQIVANTGANTTHVITLQCSLDGTTWKNTASSVTGVGLVDNVQVTARYVRGKITTVEGGTSTINVFLNAK